MNALTHHARFLRPLRSLLFVPPIAVMAYGFSKTYLHLDPAAAQLSAYLVTLPLVTGVIIAGATLEPLHRPFALLLPGLRQRQLRFASIATALTALAITAIAITIWKTPLVSPVASLGLAASLLALPHLESHRYRSNLTELGTELTTGILLCIAFGHGLAQALNTIPWLSLFGGLAFAAFALHRGYARSALRIRSQVHFVAFQSRPLVHFFSPAVAERWRIERSAAQAARTSTRNSSTQHWPQRSLDSGTREWLQTLWLLQLCLLRNTTIFRILTAAALITLVLFALYPAFGLARGQPDYWTALAAVPSRSTAFIQFLATISLALGFSAPTPTFPISRARLSRISFWRAITVWLWALLLPASALAIPALIGQLASGHLLPDYGLTALVIRTLVLAALLPLTLAAILESSHHHFVRLGATFVALIGSILVELLTPTHHLGLPRAFLLLLLTALSIARLRQRVFRHYATCDLVSGAAPIRST